MKLELSEQQVPNRKEIQAVLDFCPQRLGHVCCLNDEEWKKLKSSMIPVTFFLFLGIHYLYLFYATHAYLTSGTKICRWRYV
jgi:hypothetical protein